MTTARRKLTTLDKLKIVIAQARCPLCGEKFGDVSGLDFDHEIALVNGGTDTLDNIRAVHRAGCHKIKTHGNGATDRGSDRGEARKTRKLVEARVARGEIPADDPSIAPWAPNPDRYEPPRRAFQAAPKAKAEPQCRASKPLEKTLPPRASLYISERPR